VWVPVVQQLSGSEPHVSLASSMCVSLTRVALSIQGALRLPPRLLLRFLSC
jgi:hypothetical protein